MRKEEFLEKLRARLSQTMSQQEVTAQIRYYENYIQEQMQNGRSEEEVLTELGDPLLIAKTLMDVQETHDLHQSGITVIFLRLHDLCLYFIADHCVFYKYGITVHFSDSFPVMPHILDGYSQKIILFVFHGSAISLYTGFTDI